ncbi:glycosyltransferase family 2 protein [Paraburkholderia sp. 31.1]|uniref:glycosyltransferase family 2 protein n=1 Tax=Paraburkholderia sp. 31.1 TaxID=2615205 RepID=UPI001654FC1D|nr:glycosyltransferase [Paraburkholderia sp. 31.1]MBC8722825.1 glycosyltransferase family 2 protein [Paraburkholderia sp. 31.1]
MTKPVTNLVKNLMKNFELRPLNNVEASSNSGFAWNATNGDPQFELTGWEELSGRAARISFELAKEDMPASPCMIYFDAGAGMSEHATIGLVVDADGKVDQVVAFPPLVGPLRLDPIARAGLFSITGFNVELVADADCPTELLERARRMASWGGGAQPAPAPTVGHTYQEWIERHEPPASHYPELRARSKAWALQPLISIVMPTYNTPARWLRMAIDSVVDQVYENWEFCIADDCSTNPEVKQVLDSYAAKDPRIKVAYRTTNGHISSSSNTALELAVGEFVGLLDHDDELHPLALYCVAELINAHPDATVIYSDEDKISIDGVRSDPYFKCDFNYDLFLSQNMISHFGVYKTSVMKEVGGFRTGFEGSQDYDLALRVIDRAGHHTVYHVPRALYHWRMIPESTAAGHEAKPYAHIAAMRALDEHLARNGINAHTEHAPGTDAFNKVVYDLPEVLPSVEIIIPTRDSAGLVEQCVESVRQKSSYPNLRITIIDNGSLKQETHDLFARLQEDERIKVVRDDSPFNYSALNNRVALASTADFVCLMNNDIEVINADWLEEMVSVALQANVGAVGAKLLYPDDTIQHGGVVLGVGGIASHAHKHFPNSHPGYFARARLRNVMCAVTAACLLIRQSIYKEVGGLDEQLHVAYNDIDFCLRVRQAGYRNVWTPYAELYHHESATRGAEDTPEKISRFNQESELVRQRWEHLLMNDPCYSPNLTLTADDFSFAWPSRIANLD